MNLADLSLLSMTDTPTGGGPAGPGGDQPGQPGPSDSHQAPHPDHPPEPEQPPGHNAETTASKSSSGCVKWIFGCGCLTFVGLLVISLIALAVGFFQGPRAAGAEDWGEVMELAETVQLMSDGADSAADPDDPDSVDRLIAGEKTEEGERRGGIDAVMAVLDRPVTDRRIRQFDTTMQQWEESDSVEDFKELIEDLEALEDEDDGGLFVAVRALRLMTQFAFRANSLGREFAEFGDDDFHTDYSLLVAIVRVSQAASGDHEPWEQEVAQALLDDHDEHRDRFEETRQIVEQASADDDFDFDDLPAEEQEKLMEAYADQFLLLVSAINRESLEAWANLSDSEREAIVGHVNEPYNLIARVLSAPHFEDEPEHLYTMPFFGF